MLQGIQIQEFIYICQTPWSLNSLSLKYLCLENDLNLILIFLLGDKCVFILVLTMYGGQQHIPTNGKHTAISQSDNCVCVYWTVVQKITTFFPQWEWSLIPFYGIIGGTKKNCKLLGYHLRVPQAPLFRHKNTKDFHDL